MQNIYKKKYLKYKTKYLTSKFGGTYCVTPIPTLSIHDITDITLANTITNNEEHVTLFVKYKQNTSRRFEWKSLLGRGSYGVVSRYNTRDPSFDIAVKIGIFGEHKEAYDELLQEELVMTNMLMTIPELRKYLIEAKGLLVGNGQYELKVTVMDMYDKTLFEMLYTDQSEYVTYTYDLKNINNKLIIFTLLLRIMNAMSILYLKQIVVVDAKTENILMCDEDCYLSDFGSFVQMSKLTQSRISPTYCLESYTKYLTMPQIDVAEHMHMGFCVILLLDMIGFSLKPYYTKHTYDIVYTSHIEADLVVARALFMEKFAIENAHDYNAKLQQFSEEFITNHPVNGYEYFIGKLTQLIASLSSLL